MQFINEPDTIFYVYGILVLFMLILTVLILKKSRSKVNYFFSFTPVAFAVVLFLNMVEYLVDAPDVIARIIYILAPLGVLVAGVYIFQGEALKTNFYFLMFLFIYFLYAFVVGIYLELVVSSDLTGFMHISISFPLFLSLYYYYKVKILVPSKSKSISLLLAGTVIVILGALIRGLYKLLITTEGDYLPGLIIIISGAILIILSFTSISDSSSSD